MKNRLYNEGIQWILHEHSNGGWPPRNVNAVCGWAVVRMLAKITSRSTKEVAEDVIRRSLEKGNR